MSEEKMQTAKLIEIDFEGPVTRLTFEAPHGTRWTAGEYVIAGPEEPIRAYGQELDEELLEKVAARAGAVFWGTGKSVVRQIVIDYLRAAKAEQAPCGDVVGCQDEGCPYYGVAVKCEPYPGGCLATLQAMRPAESAPIRACGQEKQTCDSCGEQYPLEDMELAESGYFCPDCLHRWNVPAKPEQPDTLVELLEAEKLATTTYGSGKRKWYNRVIAIVKAHQQTVGGDVRSGEIPVVNEKRIENLLFNAIGREIYVVTIGSEECAGGAMSAAKACIEELRPYLRSPEPIAGDLPFDKISIDVSTGEHNAGLRAFASMPANEIIDNKGSRVALFEGYLNEPGNSLPEPVSVAAIYRAYVSQPARQPVSRIKAILHAAGVKYVD